MRAGRIGLCLFLFHAAGVRGQGVEVTEITITQVDACSAEECRQVSAVVDVRDENDGSVDLPAPLRARYAFC